MNIYTIQLGKWRLLEGTGIVLIDTTVKSAKKKYKEMFAPPTFSLVVSYKAGLITEEEYKRIYLDKLRRSVLDYRTEWLEFMTTNESVAIACYCKADKFCHRHILVDFMIDLAKENNIKVNFLGEYRSKFDNIQTEMDI